MDNGGFCARLISRSNKRHVLFFIALQFTAPAAVPDLYLCGALPSCCAPSTLPEVETTQIQLTVFHPDLADCPDLSLVSAFQTVLLVVGLALSQPGPGEGRQDVQEGFQAKIKTLKILLVILLSISVC